MKSAWLIMILLLTPLAAAGDGPREIEIFTDPGYPVTGVGAARESGITVTVYDLSAPKRAARTLGAGLPANLEQARAIVLERVNAIGAEEMKRRFKNAYRGQIQAVRYRLERYPAIVFDRGRAVVYGMTDAVEALRQYRIRRAEHDE